MKKLIALFSVFAMFGAAVLAQNPPVKKPKPKNQHVSTKRGKAAKVKVAPVKINK